MSIEGTIEDSRPASLSAGARFGGYRIERTLGHGGMGIVYLARQVELDRLVALKVIRPELAHDEHFRARFRSESRTAASIEDPRVVTVFGAGERDGLVYVAMRFVDGDDLGKLIASRGPLRPEEAAELISQVAQGLDAVHAAGLVHRDVKPANVIVADEGDRRAAYLTDFGLAKAAAATEGLTATGEVIGSVDFMAPEQIEGRRIDARTDVYALGCVLFHATTGRVPFPDRESSAKMWAHLNEPPPAASGSRGGPKALDRVIQRAMAKDPSRRYPSAGDLGRAALAAVRGEAVTEPERAVGSGEAAAAETLPIATEVALAPTVKRPRPRKRRRWMRRLVRVSLALLILAALGTAAFVGVSRVTDRGSPPAKPSGVKVPDVTGESLDVAERQLDQLGLKYTEDSNSLFGVLFASDWNVCSTDPAGGVVVRPRSTVRLLVDRTDAC